MNPIRLRVRELREAKGLSQRQLAAVAGITQATISNIETGRVKGVDFTTLEKLAKALGVNAALLIAHEPEKRGKR